jgi:hypothetical protein
MTQRVDVPGPALQTSPRRVVVPSVHSITEPGPKGFGSKMRRAMVASSRESFRVTYWVSVDDA